MSKITIVNKIRTKEQCYPHMSQHMLPSLLTPNNGDHYKRYGQIRRDTSKKRIS